MWYKWILVIISVKYQNVIYENRNDILIKLYTQEHFVHC